MSAVPMFQCGDERFHPVTLNNCWIVEYLTDKEEVLRIEPASIEAGFRVGIQRIPSREFTILTCQVRLADSTGQLWQAESAFGPSILLKHLLDLRRAEPPRLARNLPAAWQALLNGRWLTGDAYEGYDHRTDRYFDLDDYAWHVRFKHQGAYHDLFLLEGSTLLVRSRTMYAEGWNPLKLHDEAGLPLPAGAPYQRPPEGTEEFARWEESEEADDGNIPDVVHTMDVRPLLFRSTLPLKGDQYRDNDLPVPVMFRRVKGRGAPQPAVRLRSPQPLKNPSPSPLPETERGSKSKLEGSILVAAPLGQQEWEVVMQLGMIGLGRMGANMVRRLLRGGHQCVVYDIHPEAIRELVKEGAVGAFSLDELASKLTPPRPVWLMVPAAIVDRSLADLTPRLAHGDIIIDGGNSYYIDDIRRAAELRAKGLHYVDVGTSGGVWGLERGYCQMIGGEQEVVKRLDPIFATLAPPIDSAPRTPGREKEAERARALHGGAERDNKEAERARALHGGAERDNKEAERGRALHGGAERDEKMGGTAEHGYLHCGPNGAGHFVKMVHNGIEYGVMAAYAEGMAILRQANVGKHKQTIDAETTPLRDPEHYQFDLNLTDVAEVWRRGSVIASWLLDLTAAALLEDPGLTKFSGRVSDSGEGRWTIKAAIDEAVPAHVLSAALYERFSSRGEADFADKLLSAMRYEFGGHLEKTAEK